MTEPGDEFAGSRRFASAQRPRDAATLIVVRRDGARARVLMGRRHERHRFMPGKFVFPGGRLDAADTRVRVSLDLEPSVLNKLVARMRGGPSLARARGLAVAAVRETYEETGLIVGAAPALDAPGWDMLLAGGYAPDLSGLRFIMRAITPPGRTRRFDSRFFLLDARHIANLDAPLHPGSGELLESHWFGLDEALGLDLPLITRDVLERLRALFDGGPWPTPHAPVPFQFHNRNRWCIETV